MRDFIAQTIDHLVVWLRAGDPLDCWAARTVTTDALHKGAPLRHAIGAGVRTGLSRINRMHG